MEICGPASVTPMVSQPQCVVLITCVWMTHVTAKDIGCCSTFSTFCTRNNKFVDEMTGRAAGKADVSSQGSPRPGGNLLTAQPDCVKLKSKQKSKTELPLALSSTGHILTSIWKVYSCGRRGRAGRLLWEREREEEAVDVRQEPPC